MMRLYLYDDQRISTGEHIDIEDVYAPVPANATHVQPPETVGDEVAHWNGKVWTVLPERPPAPGQAIPVLEEVEGWQAEVAMKATPVDPDDPESQSVWDRVQDIIAVMPDDIEKIKVQTVLARGKIRRDSPMLAQLAPLVPLTGEQVDNLFRMASSIEA